MLILFTLFLFAACNKNDQSITFVEINGQKVPCVHIKQVKDSIPLNLSDFVSDVKFLKIETRKEAYLSYGKWIVGNKYIIVFCYESGIFQFGRDGKFIRKPASRGRGPHDVSMPVFAMSEDNGHFYISDAAKPGYYMNFDLGKGIFLKNIRACRSGRLINMIIENDTVLACAPLIGTGQPAAGSYVLRQTISGRFLDSIPAKHSEGSFDNAQDLLYDVGGILHYRPV